MSGIERRAWIVANKARRESELRAAGIDPQHWPWRSDTADGMRQWDEHRCEKLGYAARAGSVMAGDEFEERDFDDLWAKAAPPRVPSSSRDVENWTEADFIAHVQMHQRNGGTGGYRSLSKLTEGWDPTALFRRWQKVSGRKPWPSGQKNRTTRTTR